MSNRFREQAGLNRPAPEMQQVRVAVLGDTGYVLLGLELRPAFDPEGNMVVLVAAFGGSKAALELGGPPTAAIIGEVCKLPVVDVAKALGYRPTESSLVAVP